MAKSLKKNNKKHLYCVTLDGGTTHPEYTPFSVEVGELGGVHPDRNGMSGALVCHHIDAKTLKLLITYNMNDGDDVIVEEVTKATLKGHHFGYVRLIDSYFRPHYKLYV